jgi:hypothetical protein
MIILTRRWVGVYLGDSHASKHDGGQNLATPEKKKTKRIYDLVDIVA